MNGWLARNQQKIAIFLGYAVVFLLAFGLGKITASVPRAPEIKVEEQSEISQVNDTPTVQGLQSAPQPAAASTTTASAPPDCVGKIKGNISSSSRIYHLPGGAFYDRTAAEMCFDTEAQAKEAGFRKSTR